MARMLRFRRRRQVEVEAEARCVAEQLAVLAAGSAGRARHVLGEARRELLRYGLSGEGVWPGGFTMVSRVGVEAVLRRVRELPGKKRPGTVLQAFMLMLCYVEPSSGEVLLSREEFAEKLGVDANRVSTVMSTLERMGVVRRDWTRVEGLRGRGVVTYVVNPDVAWNGTLEEREVEAERFPRRKPFEVVDGGKARKRRQP